MSQPADLTRVLKVPVDRTTYGALRSFVDSSTRPSCEYNTPFADGSSVWFVKPGRWTLAVNGGSKVVLRFMSGSVVLDTRARVLTLSAGPLTVFARRLDAGFEVEVAENETVRLSGTFANVFFVGTSDHPPVFLPSLISKLERYTEIAKKISVVEYSPGR